MSTTTPKQAEFHPDVIKAARKAADFAASWRVTPAKEQGRFMAESQDIKQVFAFGASHEEAISEASERLAVTLAYLVECGDRPPKPFAAFFPDELFGKKAI